MARELTHAPKLPHVGAAFHSSNCARSVIEPASLTAPGEAYARTPVPLGCCCVADLNQELCHQVYRGRALARHSQAENGSARQGGGHGADSAVQGSAQGLCGVWTCGNREVDWSGEVHVTACAAACDAWSLLIFAKVSSRSRFVSSLRRHVRGACTCRQD